jgi:divalent metal cation (Fe/Co/Zn/Cd) transporter
MNRGNLILVLIGILIGVIIGVIEGDPVAGLGIALMIEFGIVLSLMEKADKEPEEEG